MSKNSGIVRSIAPSICYVSGTINVNMALVMLPCDLPWWSNVQKKLAQIEESSCLDVVIDVMQKLHELCKWVAPLKLHLC